MAFDSGQRACATDTSVWGGPRGLPVRLTLGPDVPDLPPLHGRLVRSFPGYFGVLRYLLELDAPLPYGFDPFGELPWFARVRRLRHLLITPASHLPTIDTPSNFIGLCMARGDVARVFVSVGPHPSRVPAGVAPTLPETRYPFLAMGDLQSLARSRERHREPIDLGLRTKSPAKGGLHRI